LLGARAEAEPVDSGAHNAGIKRHRDASTSRCLVLNNWRSPAELEAHFNLTYMKHVVSVLGEALDGGHSPAALLRETHFVAPNSDIAPNAPALSAQSSQGEQT
jgi:hypothetical protein